jgi:Rieske Fe-S protein
MSSCPFDSCRVRPAGLPDDFLTRREWIKRFVVGSAVSVASGSFNSVLLAEISPGANPANIIKFDIFNYPVLYNAYGSMRFNLFGSTIANGIITVTRAPGDVFHVVSAYCTHNGCIVNAYDNSPGKQSMICQCHGSVFDISGRIIDAVTNNQANLPQYNSSLNGTILSVEIPNLNFKVNSIAQQSVNGATRRFRLTFPTKQGARYRVKFTEDLAKPPVTIPFFTTATGASSVTIVTQTAPTPNPRTVYVDSTSAKGFYVVEMVVDPYLS